MKNLIQIGNSESLSSRREQAGQPLYADSTQMEDKEIFNDADLDLLDIIGEENWRDACPEGILIY